MDTKTTMAIRPGDPIPDDAEIIGWDERRDGTYLLVNVDVDVIPEWQEFTYYLHDTASGYERQEHLEDKGIMLDAEAWENMGRPFYEVALKCRVHRSGEVEILGVEQ